MLSQSAEAAGRRTLRAWSAGCASGEEPYTLRLLWNFTLARRFPALRLEVVATDTNEHLLDRARRQPAATRHRPSPGGLEATAAEAVVSTSRDSSRGDLSGSPLVCTAEEGSDPPESNHWGFWPSDPCSGSYPLERENGLKNTPVSLT